MEISRFRHQCHLHGYQIAFIFLMLLGTFSAQAQESREYNLPNYDNRFVTFGFTLGGHTATLRPKFSPTFASQFQDTLNILPANAFGFSIGFLANFRAAEYLNVRIMPKVAFYDYKLLFETSADEVPGDPLVADFTTVDLPISLKFVSQRRENHRMFVTAGITPVIDVTGKKTKEENYESGLRISGNNLTADLGFGADFYFPLFKFSPEIRYSYGVKDVLESKTTQVGRAFDGLGTHIWAVYLVFN